VAISLLDQGAKLAIIAHQGDTLDYHKKKALDLFKVNEVPESSKRSHVCRDSDLDARTA